MSEPTMAAGFAQAFLDFAAARGASRAAMLRASGLTEAELADPEARLPRRDWHRLLGAAVDLTGDPLIVLRSGLGTRAETMSVVGGILARAPTLREGLRQLNRYARLIVDGARPASDPRHALIEGRETWIEDRLPLPDGFHLAAEGALGQLIGELRATTSDRPVVLAVDLAFPPPAHAAGYADLLRVPVRFDAGRMAVRVDPDCLDLPRPEAAAYVFGLFTGHADTLMAKLAARDTVRAAVETRMLADLHQGSLSMDAVARDLGLGRQTLYRRLKDEGTTFAQVHDDLRRRMAMEYLGARRVSVGETAYLLGFSEASAFVRAFKRWTGVSPTAWRAGAG
ncbi:AraC family transcriptional regulator [uncultured Jannaschia sp.]|uniref:AraC family transcriptional regulator n=1 Tax=uncultured Jannaschia sp. TaxID=293347 RepID=UPI00260AD217|nr:AraC family transcriptional regulator [uncultured Jannaschia sp.]